MNKKIILAAAVLLTLFSLFGIALSFPAASICMFADYSKSQVKQTTLIEQAKSRISNKFGSLQAKPRFIFFENTNQFWPFNINTYGSTSLVGNNLCVIIGPNGNNIDVVAHELLHAELFDRIGYWNSLNNFPVWFNEGIAMQVDFRTKYDWHDGSSIDSIYVRQLESDKQFFVSDSRVLTQHYAAAKYEIRKWLDKIGNEKLFLKIDSLAQGYTFQAILDTTNTSSIHQMKGKQ